MSSREQILRKLRAVHTTHQPPFADFPPVAADQRQHMIPVDDASPDALLSRFIQAAESLPCKIYCVRPDEAVPVIVNLIGADDRVLSWQPQHIPVPGLADGLAQAGIAIAPETADDVRVGITGVDAALAATGSLVLLTGAGKARATSLLPDVHIAVMTPDQITGDLEMWLAAQKAAGLAIFRQSSNIMIVTGPSKTADIAQELIKGAHGPREVHIVMLV